jgi:hypothetical protein
VDDRPRGGGPYTYTESQYARKLLVYLVISLLSIFKVDAISEVVNSKISLISWKTKSFMFV